MSDQETPLQPQTNIDIDTIEHSRFVEAKNMRKRAEEDAKLLANRIALLRLEEAKALKKIEDTRKQAREIMETRMRNAESQKKKEEERRLREDEEKMRIMQNKQFREQNLQAISSNR